MVRDYLTIILCPPTIYRPRRKGGWAGAPARLKAWHADRLTSWRADWVAGRLPMPSHSQHGIFRSERELVEAFGDVTIVPTFEQVYGQQIIAAEVVPRIVEVVEERV